MAKRQSSQLQKAKGVRVKIIGLGGGGCSIVAEMSQRLPGVSFVAADTDLVNLQRVKNDHLALFSFGSETTCGLGTGMNSHLGAKVARAARDEVGNLFTDADLFILVSCLGGGVGSGSLPVFAQAAREKDALGIGVFTMPFSFEGQKRQRLAQKSLKDSSPYLDARLILANEKIFKVAGDQTSFSAALSLINQSLVQNLNALIDVVRQPSLINIDFSDLRAILRGHDQMAFLNNVVAQGDKRLDGILQGIKRYDFYYSEPQPADKLLLHVAGGADLKMAEVSAISQEVKKPNPGAQIIFGVDRRVNLKNQIRATLLSINCTKEKPAKPEQSPKKFSREKDPAVKPKKTSGPRKPKAVGVKVDKKTVKKKALKKKATKVPVRTKKVKRLNALDLKEKKKKSEFQKTSQEKIWEIPAFLRRKS